MTYYAVVILFLCAALMTLCILVHENGRFSPKTKHTFYITFLVIALSSLAEMAAVLLNGAPDWTRAIHAVVKCFDYIVTPCAAICFVFQISRSDDILNKVFYAIMGLNAILQVVSLFTGWMFYIDENNIYRHGPWYTVYICVYGAAILATIIKFYRYGKSFPRDNIRSLIAIALIVIGGVMVQEITGLRTCCVGLMLGSLLLFIHSNEFAQQHRDETVLLQHQLLETDPLTGLFSRYAYNEALNELSSAALDPATVIFSFDANGLKQANDTAGHLAGDELIRGAADCLRQVFAPYGKCYRTGGDEFVTIARLSDDQLKSALDQLEAAARAWKGELVSELSFAVGYAAARQYPDLSIEKLFNCADHAMYESKAQYYCRAGHDRRQR